MPRNQVLEIYRGDTFSRSFTLGPSASGEEWAYTDLDDVAFTVRQTLPPTATISDADAMGQAKLSAGTISFSTATDGRFTIPKSTTTTWAPGTYFWDLSVTYPGSPEDEAHTLLSGTLRVRYDITRATT